jgi:flotillin
MSNNIAERNSSGLGTGLFLIIIALVFIVGPIMAHEYLSGLAQTMIIGFGALLLLIGGFIVIVTKLYVKASQDLSFIRSGMGGSKVVIGGGALVIPVVHQVAWVLHETMRISVSRMGKDALLTSDNLRADFGADFFIKVPRDEPSVLAAGTSLGERATDVAAFEKFLFSKLEGALRGVAAAKSLEQLNADRVGFSSAVQEALGDDLKHNGLVLETVSITKLDQTPLREVEANDNMFDAKGATIIAEVVAKQKQSRNQIELAAKQAIAQQDLEAQRIINERKVEQETNAAETVKQISIAQARADREAQEAKAEQHKLAEQARLTSEQAIAVSGQEKEKAELLAKQQVEIAEVERQQAIAVAQQASQQAQETAEVVRLQAIELKKREQEIAVAEKEKELAEKTAERLAAEKTAAEAQQALETANAVGEADRNKQVAVKEEEATAERLKVRQNMEADTSAYALTKQAEAEKQAAQDRAEALRTEAEANKQVKVLEAEGLKAIQMVPVDVSAEEVKVEAASLENQAKFQQITVQLETIRLTINANKEVEIERAKALAQAFAGMNTTVWGSTDHLETMSKMFALGQAGGTLLSGLQNTTPEGVLGFLEGMLGKQAEVVPSEQSKDAA